MRSKRLTADSVLPARDGAQLAVELLAGVISPVELLVGLHALLLPGARTDGRHTREGKLSHHYRDSFVQ